ncbi:hypothetical protein K0U27_08720 [archaeon]|nr:hypothetical protein [archaeon]
MTSTVAKAGIITAIVFIGFIMILLGFTVVPSIFNQYIVTPVDVMSDDEFKQRFLESEEYQAFTKRFPDHDQNFSRSQHGAGFEAGSVNSETGNTLLLEMTLQGKGDIHDKYVECESDGTANEYENNSDARGVFVKNFIENTDCLD